ncbi:MAG: hypothetical protein ACLRIA_11870 [Ruminococcus sp.]
MAVKIYHGDILFTPSADRLEIHENSYIIVEDGVVSQICEKIPEQYQGAEVVDYGDKLIIPAFSDLHVHGAQYVQRGIGMDCLLSDWLNHYTFPQESRFQNMEYAKNCFKRIKEWGRNLNLEDTILALNIIDQFVEQDNDNYSTRIEVRIADTK